MKNKIIILGLAFVSLKSFSCDSLLQAFPRDCQIQDRYAKVSAELKQKNVNIEEIAEYRVLRFIGRSTWDKAIQNKTVPEQIYTPAPATWQVWDKGIRSVFTSNAQTGAELKGKLFTGYRLNNSTISEINKVLLTDGVTSIKDYYSDQKKKPGEMRKAGDEIVGFCDHKKPEKIAAIDSAEMSLRRYQQSWEQKSGISFVNLVKEKSGINAEKANISTQMRATDYSCGYQGYMYIAYAPSENVAEYMDWFRIFVEKNLENLKNNKSAISPVELAAIAQKWFVSVHPFSDGNGRTSRAIQDLILANFGLPFAPGGDLQDDALSEAENYIEENYSKLEKMLSSLESCLAELKSGNKSFQCAEVKELNSGAFKQQPEVK